LLRFFKYRAGDFGLAEVEGHGLRPNAIGPTQLIAQRYQLSSERATRKTLRPRAASLRAKTSPMPLEAPVIRVVFIKRLVANLGDYVSHASGRMWLKIDDVDTSILKISR